MPFELIKLVPKSRNRRKYGKYDKWPLEVSDICLRPNRRSIVVVTTFTTSLSITNAVGNKFFTHILMDEGSQTREPEAIAPLSLASINTKIVIAGCGGTADTETLSKYAATRVLWWLLNPGQRKYALLCSGT